jgi:molecular chaperone GrpE
MSGKPTDQPPATDNGLEPNEGTNGGAVGQDESRERDELRRTAAEANDRVLRIQAEMENFRKRTRREMEEERRFASLSLLRDLLPVNDNLARAIEAGEKTHDAEKLIEGIKLVAQQLDEALAKHGCKRIPALGQPFDPNHHEALTQQPSPDHQEPTVLTEVRAGFTLHDRVIRPAQVIVSAIPNPSN